MLSRERLERAKRAFEERRRFLTAATTADNSILILRDDCGKPSVEVLIDGQSGTPVEVFRGTLSECHDEMTILQLAAAIEAYAGLDGRKEEGGRS